MHLSEYKRRTENSKAKGVAWIAIDQALIISVHVIFILPFPIQTDNRTVKRDLLVDLLKDSSVARLKLNSWTKQQNQNHSGSTMLYHVQQGPHCIRNTPVNTDNH